MRISLLLQREPFGEIFEKTLSDFLRSYFGQFYTVKWRKASSLANSGTNKQIWLCNPYLNAIFVLGAHKQTFLPVIQEFSRSTKWWRRPIQKLYIELSTKQWTCKWFASYVIEISPPLKKAEHFLILGGNHHIRLLDYNEGKAFVIQKVGFDRAFIANDICVRRQNSYLPTPAIYNVAEDGSWYSEELIAGTPINRLKGVEKSKRLAENAIKVLSRLYKNTARKAKTVGYALEIIKRIEKQIKACLNFTKDRKENILKELLDLKKAVNCLQNNDMTVAQTHGDFQPANILVDNNRIWIIDWEYTAERQIVYDGLVFALKARFSQGLDQRILQAIKGDLQGCGQLLELIPDVQWHDIDKRYSMLILFLLEDMELKLRETCSSVFFDQNQEFTKFWEQAKQTIQVIIGKF